MHDASTSCLHSTMERQSLQLPCCCCRRVRRAVLSQAGIAAEYLAPPSKTIREHLMHFFLGAQLIHHRCFVQCNSSSSHRLQSCHRAASLNVVTAYCEMTIHKAASSTSLCHGASLRNLSSGCQAPEFEPRREGAVSTTPHIFVCARSSQCSGSHSGHFRWVVDCLAIRRGSLISSSYPMLLTLDATCCSVSSSHSITDLLQLRTYTWSIGRARRAVLHQRRA